MNTGEQSGALNFSVSSFGTQETGAGVASLDSPLVQQTKSEIRTLAAEIAELAHRPISPDEFYEGFLPRLCVAMGASSAAVWCIHLTDSANELDAPQQDCRLTASHGLPAILLDAEPASATSEPRPSEEHLRILRCVIAEGQPILVPPSDVQVDAQRPVNPLDDALIVVPVRIEEDVEFLLEVVQKPAGGPAAQRGYLRFVAQMADLMADYVRRQHLRELSSREEHLQQTEEWLLRIAQQAGDKQLAGTTASGVCQLLEADQTLLLRGRSRPKLVATSNASTIDARSELALVAQRLVKHLVADRDEPLWRWLHATDRRGQSAQAINGERVNEGPAHNRPLSPDQRPQDLDQETQALVDELCGLLRCRRILSCWIDEDAETLVLVAFAANCLTLEQTTADWENKTQQLLRAVGALYASGLQVTSSWYARLLPTATKSQTRRRMDVVQRWITRVAIAALVFAIAAFPVPQQISATAILQPQTKVPYYAPMAGTVAEVFVDEGQWVVQGQPLVRLSSRQLDQEIDQLEGELQLVEDQITSRSNLLNRGNDLKSNARDRLEGELEQLRISQRSLSQQLGLLRRQQSELLVVAYQAGRVSSWDLRNRLQLRPVIAGESLLATYQPEGRWKLRLSIPDRRIGLVTQMLESGSKGVLVRFSLSSHPDEVHDAFVMKLASHASQQSRQAGAPVTSVVYADAILDDSVLSIKKDGAVAHATIECGRVPLVWLVVRDAYWAVSSRIRMVW